jgi:uncharacterized protein
MRKKLLEKMEGIAQSPCIRNCCLDADDICVGCYRSILEITQWGPANNQERIIILQNAQKRRDASTEGAIENSTFG